MYQKQQILIKFYMTFAALWCGRRDDSVFLSASQAGEKARCFR